MGMMPYSSLSHKKAEITRSISRQVISIEQNPWRAFLTPFYKPYFSIRGITPYPAY
jgi:hypothetical protein